jgi:hypothetical protein
MVISCERVVSDGEIYIAHEGANPSGLVVRRGRI